MQYLSINQYQNSVLLFARTLMMLLFVNFGFEKLVDFQGTVGYMTHINLPLPTMAAAIAVMMEFFAGIAIILGFYTRPIALLLVLYTLGTTLIGHPFWKFTDQAHMINEINFFKNISIMGGLLLLALSGPGKYSLDKK